MGPQDRSCRRHFVCPASAWDHPDPRAAPAENRRFSCFRVFFWVLGFWGGFGLKGFRVKGFGFGSQGFRV